MLIRSLEIFNQIRNHSDRVEILKKNLVHIGENVKKRGFK